MDEKLKCLTTVYAFVVLDLPHMGHVKLLERAKQMGDTLIVGVLTDKAVMTYKPKPIMSYKERFGLTAAFRCVDRVVKQNTRSPGANVLKYKPDIVVHGDDWSKDSFPGKEEMLEVGAALVLVPYYDKQSTSKLKEKIWRVEE